MAGVKVIWNQFLKDSEKAPGWIPLLAVVLLWLELCGLPKQIQVLDRSVSLSVEVLASVLTFLFYQLGDAIDEVVFKDQRDGKTSTKVQYKNEYSSESTEARDALHVNEEGLYALAAKVTKAAEKERKTIFINLFNEGAKFLRSLIVPFFALAVYYFLNQQAILGLTLLGSSVLALKCYPWLKVKHVKRLYASAALVGEKIVKREGNEFELFFWDGKFIDAGITASQKR
jgi:hypothetical protein